ncbi:segmentation protein cap'n'collar isoform X2 [Stomoxys calcitrans]|uniref:segmentation protein cap'n'collar isoform X2 n=1 Tax=Stomoxys calcitrans TaxID=35570 RepID=UPI0027E318FB|nr:segmentation protein cap'n'collar isoform X2 [Stomoxys calcitrans]
MISNKKSYAMKMLQLALALSLLHVNPDDYLQQRLQNWDSQLELRDGDGWELEMLRAVPMVEYPYANRKTIMPLIEDLVLYDHSAESLANTQYNVTAYLLNVSNESANQTAAMQEMQALPASSATVASNSPPATASSSAASASLSVLEGGSNPTTVSSVVQAPGSSNSTHLHAMTSPEIELFLNSESLQDQRSVWEQNLADLNDFNDLPLLNSHYGNLPLKDGQQQDNSLFDLQQLDVFLPTFGSSATSVTETDGAVALNDTFPNPDDEAGVKLEQFDDEDDKALLVGIIDTKAVCSTISTDAVDINETCIKKEETEESSKPDTQESEVDLSPFISNVEMKKEPKFDDKDDADDQLAANEWAGIPFTIDNETGEYIRLPLDEILNDVIQFAELAGETSEDDEDTGASTSKAAAAANIKKHLKSDKEENDNSNNDTDNTSSSANNSAVKSNASNQKCKSEGDAKDDKDLKTDGSHKVVTSKKKRQNKKEQAKNIGENHEADSEGEDDDNDNTESESESDSDADDNEDDDLPQSEIEVSSLPSPLFDLDDEANEELNDLSMMLHSSAPFAPHHHPHHPHHPHHRGAGGAGGVGGSQNYGGVNSAFHRQPSSGGFHHGHHQGRMPLSRGVSMEQRLQDIASLFNPIPSMGVVGGVSEMSPYPHYPTHPYSYQGAPQHAQYPPPPPHPHHHHHAAAAAMLHPNASLGDLCSSQPHYGHNLGSAVTSSMHLTNSTHDSDVTGVGAGAVGGAYKMEHDMMYYSNPSSDMNHTTDGFINSILNDEDLHLMDMNVNDSFCRMVDVNNSTSNNSSVLGLPTGGGNGGPASGSSTTGSTTSGLSMSGASNVAAAAAGAPGMTSDLMNSTTAAGAQAVGGGNDRLDASSDSAVSSMGSERVPSLSDGEWGEGSDSAQDYHQGKYGGPYDYSYNNTNTNSRLNDGSRQPPVAQKKHHMFGKRYLNEQPTTNGANGATAGAGATTANGNGVLVHGPAHAIKYEYEAYPPVAGLHENMGHGLDNGAMGGAALSKEHHAYGSGAYSLDFSLRTPRTPHELIQHNHTYTLPQGTGSLPRPQQRDKKLSTSSSTKSSKSSAHNSSGSGGEEDSYMTRDEKRARAMNIPIPVIDIINLPMDEFNERLSKYDLSENQLSLIRDIRRRGKNKVAAQNCRKRKLDQILSLEDEVKQVRRRKDELQSQRERLFAERKRVSNKFSALHRHIFQYLRDSEGNPCSPSEYSLQQAADGSIYLLPRDAANKNDTSGSLLNGSPVNSGSSQAIPAHHTTTQMNGHTHGAPTGGGSGAAAAVVAAGGGTHHLQQAPHQAAYSHLHHHQQQHPHQQQQQHHHHHHPQSQQQTSHASTATSHQTHGVGHQQQPQKD